LVPVQPIWTIMVAAKLEDPDQVSSKSVNVEA